MAKSLQIEMAKKKSKDSAERRNGRPAFSRDHYWLDWCINDGLTVAKIRDRWDDMSDSERMSICPTTPDKIGGKDSQSKKAGYEVVKKALGKAKAERGL